MDTLIRNRDKNKKNMPNWDWDVSGKSFRCCRLWDGGSMDQTHLPGIHGMRDQIEFKVVDLASKLNLITHYMEARAD